MDRVATGATGNTMVMTGVYTLVQIEILRLGRAIVRYWRRIVVGAFVGWLLSTVLGALALAWLEARGIVSSEETSALLGAGLVWSGTALGGLVSYAVRPSTRAGMSGPQRP